MKKFAALLLTLVMVLGIFMVPAQADNVTVMYNGEKMTFDVQPVIVNDRTMVPMRAIFEALGCSVSWDDATEQAIGIKNGKKVVVAIGNTTAYNGGKFIEIDQPPLLIDDRTMVPLRFISEAYDCKVDWDEKTQTVTITNDNDLSCFHLGSTSFTDLGDWTRDGAAMKGRMTRDTFLEEGKEIPAGKDAVATINVTKPGKYKVWILARDFAKNQQGTRYFTVSVGGVRSAKTFGKHGQEGFVWEDAGEFDLQKGANEVRLIDTSAFHARCNGIFITNNLKFTPGSDTDIGTICPALGAYPEMPVVMYPAWTKQDFAPEKTASIENDKFKIEFYKGTTENGPLVQNAVYVKDNGNLVNVKKRSEEFAYMLQRADSAKYNQVTQYQYFADTTFELNGKEVSVSTDDMFEMAPISWCIPTDFNVIDQNTIEVTFTNGYASVSATFAMDGVYDEPLVTLNSTFAKDGNYSFVLYNGEGVAKEDFDTVTAPLLFVKHALPEKANVLVEPFMFTPMNTLYYTKERNKAGNNKEFTSGLAVDPTVVRQGFSHPEDAQYGTAFYTPDNKVRPHLVAPVMGDNNHFAAGDTYSFKFRILNDFKYWYDTYKHVGVDMYNTKDIRDNYYTSFNEAIYNTTELWLDDFYGGWDDIDKSYYNMEAKDVTTQADPLEAVQRYALTDNKTILEERTVPTVAYILSRGTKSFQHSAEMGGLTSSYITTEVPSPIGKPVDYSASVYGGLYEMTQGRMPYLLKYALEEASAGAIPDIATKYKFTGDKGFYNMLILKADEYLEKTSCMSGENYDKMFTTGFVYTDYARLLNTLLLAYEYTGEQKYLDGANKAGQLTMTSTWNTGYHNGYDYNTYHIEDTHVPYVHDGNEHFFWHGSFRWRLGNPIEEGAVKSGLELGKYIPTEDVPGWLPAQAGLGTEHPFTPKYGAINQMNVWAGSIMRLAKYTGDDYYVTQARNAMIGRFGNYPGYGRERYITHNQYPDYPYTGPDYTGIYYHHIPVFMGMIEDYLINDVWYRSDAKIEFPSLAQYGYAYFDMNRYGQASGKFYDEDNMWLWIDDGILKPDNRSIDYITARKAGTLGIALVNEKLEAVTTTVTLGDKIENAAAISGTATVLDAKGNKSETAVTNGSFTVTVPAKGITSVIIKSDSIKDPSYIRDFKYSTELGQTVTEHKNGKGFVIQLSDDLYHAYTYVTDKDLKQLEITYTADGETKTETTTQYPFEFLIRVNDPKSDFVYTLKATKADGTIEDMGGGTLRTIDNSQGLTGGDVSVNTGTYYSADGSSIYTRDKTTAPSFSKTEAKINRIGRGDVNGASAWKFIVEKSTFPFDVNESNVESLKNIGVVMDWKHKSVNKEIVAASYVTKAEMADDGQRISLYVAPTFELPSNVKAFDNADYKITMDVYHDSPTNAEVGVKGDGAEITYDIPDFEPTEIKVNSKGRDGVNWRYVVPLSSLPFKETADDCMKGMKIKATYTSKSDKKDVRVLESEVIRNELRSDKTSMTLVVPATEEVPMKNPDGSVFDDSLYDVKVVLIRK